MIYKFFKFRKYWINIVINESKEQEFLSNTNPFYLFKLLSFSINISESPLLEEDNLLFKTEVLDRAFFYLINSIYSSIFSIPLSSDKSFYLYPNLFFLLFSKVGYFLISFSKYSFCSLYRVIKVSIYLVPI